MTKKNHIPIICFLILCILSCSKTNDTSPKNNLIGKWELKTLIFDYDIISNGKSIKDKKSLNGTLDDIIEFKIDNTIDDPNDAFLATQGKANEWDFKILGNEMSIGDDIEISYFTFNQSTKNLTLKMNTVQAKKSMNESKYFNLIMDLKKEDEILKYEYTLEFKKK